MSPKIVELEDLSNRCKNLRSAGKKIVATNGHFDLLHVGHVRYLQAARALGDLLVVGVNDDTSTTARKGLGRPIIPADEPIALLRPDIYVKGGDYATTDADARAGKTPLPEAPLVRSYGGAIVTIP